MSMTIRKLARDDPDVFHFVRTLLGMRIGSNRWTCCRELGRLWWRAHGAGRRG
jgi:hypothetical protein